MTPELLLAIAVALLMLAVILQEDWRWLREFLGNRVGKARLTSEASGVRKESSESVSTEKLAGEKPGSLRALTADQILRVTGATPMIEHLYRLARLPRSVFDRDIVPAIVSFAEFVQLLPASESHHHAHVGGLLAHTLETSYHALTLRNGKLLAHSAGAEAMDAQRDYYTYAVILGALFHDIGKPLSDLRIAMFCAGRSESAQWNPMAGSLIDCQAYEYQVAFTPKCERDYAAHSRMGLVLMQRLVPATALGFLGRCPDAMSELTQYLSGEPTSIVGKIVAEADQRSTAANLASGSRARFGTARRIPLVEQLMSALQAMLAEGGHLPLNRDGAAGWIFDGSAWFVAKRLADSVRDYIRARAGDDSDIPGEQKNDRLFDAWMEYGQIELNPSTKKAIWHVRVVGDDGDGYSHDLSVLRFDIKRLWPNPDACPGVMAGRIEVLSGRGGRTSESQAKENAEDNAGTHEVAQDADPPVAENAKSVNRRKSCSAEPFIEEIASPVISSGLKSRQKKRGAGMNPPKEADLLSDNQTAKVAHQQYTAAKKTAIPFVDKDEVSGDEVSSEETRCSDDPQKPTTLDLERVSLPESRILNTRRKGNKEPSAVAESFLAWVQTGLADGSMKYNESGALVHFVENGMALVSPAIFREYAMLYGEPGTNAAEPSQIGLQTQKEVIRAGWHLQSPVNGANIWTFEVSRRGGNKTGRLSAVVLGDSSRWIMEPPPANCALRLPGEAMPSEGP